MVGGLSIEFLSALWAVRFWKFRINPGHNAFAVKDMFARRFSNQRIILILLKADAASHIVKLIALSHFGCVFLGRHQLG
jgi:hypothetical protein